MLRWLQSRSRRVAATVLLSVLAFSSAAPHAADGHDDHAAGLFEPHDPDAHRIGSAPSELPDHARHCAICHLTRSLRPGWGDGHQLSAPADVPAAVHTTAVRPPRVFPAAQPPLRSPPASPSL